MTTHLSALVLAAEGEPNPLMPHLSEVIVGLIAFALLFLFLRAKVFPMFEKAYADRTRAIEGGIQRAEEAQAEAQRALVQYRAQLADARGEAAAIRDEAREQGRQIVEEMRASAQAEAARITERANAQLAAERTQLVGELRTEIGTLAVDLASRIVGESLEDEARQRRTVDRFLADLNGQQPAGAAVGAPGTPGIGTSSGGDEPGGPGASRGASGGGLARGDAG